MKDKNKVACKNCHILFTQIWECPKCGRLWRNKEHHLEKIRYNLDREEFIEWLLSYRVPVSPLDKWSRIKKVVMDHRISASDLKEFFESRSNP